MADEDLDIMRDLQFLLTKNDVLEASRSQVQLCPLTDDGYSGIKPEDRFRVKQNREIESLRREIALLNDQLLEKRNYVVQKSNVASRWEKLARHEFYEKSKALRDNERLRLAVHEHAAFISEVTKQIWTKKPRLTQDLDPVTEAWQSFKLAAHSKLRIAAIHSIANRQYARLQTHLIQAGLVDQPDNVIQSKILPQPNGQVIVESVHHVALAAPFHAIGAAVWKVITDKVNLHWPSGGFVSTEMFDQFTMYQTSTRANNLDRATVRSNVIYKYFVEPEQEIIVWRSILEDERLPQTNLDSVHNESGWIMVTPISPRSCRITVLVRVTPESVHKQGQALSTR
ncbi:hypothetical protein AeMF1_012688 [Aphanomyces euteiches]|nr:hypothetical protein AeMF1_012688 [Aphanomyces euteiches]